MSKSQPPRLRQSTITDADDGDPEHTRASTAAFKEHLDNYANASINYARGLADDPDLDEVDSFTVRRQLGNGSRINLVECPVCYTPLRPSSNVGDHIATHRPEEFGLSPLDEAEQSTTPDESEERAKTPDSQSSFRDW